MICLDGRIIGCCWFYISGVFMGLAARYNKCTQDKQAEPGLYFIPAFHRSSIRNRRVLLDGILKYLNGNRLKNIFNRSIVSAECRII